VIGINTAINPRANTIGFAVPIDMAKGVLPQLRASGHVTRGWLGVVIQGVTPELGEELGLKENKGALVSKVIDDGPGAAAGIQKMDVIREFDGQPVDSYDDLPRIVAATPINKKVDIAVIRDGKRVVLHPQIAMLEEPELQKTAATTRRRRAVRSRSACRSRTSTASSRSSSASPTRRAWSCRRWSRTDPRARRGCARAT
jgi:serine protease Do